MSKYKKIRRKRWPVDTPKPGLIKKKRLPFSMMASLVKVQGYTTMATTTLLHRYHTGQQDTSASCSC